jgi:hypothetical protein
LLNELRAVIRDNHEAFPVEELERVMAARGKSLSFGPEEVDDLLDLEYGDRKVFPLLSILYPFIDVKQLHHVDHFFPKGLLTRRKLEPLGLDAETIERCVAARDELPNLQLLEGLLNVAKNDKTPSEWLALTCPNETARQAVIDRHDLGGVPDSAASFLPFLEARREKMRQRLVALLGGGTAATAAVEAA